MDIAAVVFVVGLSYIVFVVAFNFEFKCPFRILVPL